MPMEDSYWEQMKSPIADMKNTGGRMGGAITAALFLEKYVDTEKVRVLTHWSTSPHMLRVASRSGAGCLQSSRNLGRVDKQKKW